MIITDYKIMDSKIKSAEKGFYSVCAIPKGKIIAFPDNINKIYTDDEVNNFEKGTLEYNSSVRWFEKYYSHSTEWSDECYINHSFNPNCLWHMGFIFALQDIKPDEEITIDYRFLLQEGENPGFKDSATNLEIKGFPWSEALRRSSLMLSKILSRQKENHA
ncbi:MAG: SET domain-containing protein [Candidatus Wallbacteria bacterium]